MTTADISKPFAQELLKNNLALQKVSLQLIEAVHQMTARMDRILGLFEEAAKHIEQAQPKESFEKQLEELLEQNRVIARGLVLLEKFIRDKTSVGFERSEQSSPQPLPRL